MKARKPIPAPKRPTVKPSEHLHAHARAQMLSGAAFLLDRYRAPCRLFWTKRDPD